MTPFTTSAGGLATALVLLAGCGPGIRDPGEEPARTEFYGLNAQNLVPLAIAGEAEVLDAHLDRIAELGVGYVRANVAWAQLEPQPAADGGYSFAAHDAWVEALARHGLRWQATAIGVTTPPWAADPIAARACGTRGPPRPEPFAAMVAALARRYGSAGSFWAEHPELPRLPVVEYEVWNEPNWGAFWCPSPDPEAYARLYVATRSAVHAADPEAEVVFGGLTSLLGDVHRLGGLYGLEVDAFLTRAIRAEPSLRTGIDALAIHPYGNTPDRVLANLARFRAIADDHGLDQVPLVVNEVGWFTSGPPPPHAPAVPEDRRARYLAEAVARITAAGCGVSSVAAHTWITPESEPANAEHWYGIADPVTAEPYRSAAAYGAVIALMAGDAPTGSPPAPSDYRCEP